MSKLEDTRIVTFKEDYTGRQGKPKEGEPPVIVYMKKGETHALHKRVLAKLIERGAKVDVKEVDTKKVYADAKRRHEDQKERREKDAYKK